MLFTTGFTVEEEIHILDALYDAMQNIGKETVISTHYKKRLIREHATAYAKIYGIMPHANSQLHNARELHIERKETVRKNDD